jgi:hypothetical protein
MPHSLQTLITILCYCEQVGRAGAEAAASTQRFAEGFEVYAANNLLSVILKVHGEMRQVMISSHNFNYINFMYLQFHGCAMLNLSHTTITSFLFVHDSIAESGD